MKNLIRMFLVVLLAITATIADAQVITNTKVKHKDNNKRKSKVLYEPPRYNQGYAYPRYSGGFIGKSYYGYRSSKKNGGFYDQKGRYYYQ
jgi:hypothetical protein